MKSVEERVKNIISEQLGVGLSQVTRSASVAGDLGGDSLDRLELVIALEESFDIRIDDDELHRVSTVGDVIDYVGKHVVVD